MSVMKRLVKPIIAMAGVVGVVGLYKDAVRSVDKCIDDRAKVPDTLPIALWREKSKREFS